MAAGSRARFTTVCVAILYLTLAGCDVDLFGTDAHPVIGPYKLLVWEGGKYSLITDVRDGCGVLGGTVTRIGWNDRVILAEQETCGAWGARSGWMVVDVKTRAIEGPIDPATIAKRPDLPAAGIKVISAEVAWKKRP